MCRHGSHPSLASDGSPRPSPYREGREGREEGRRECLRVGPSWRCLCNAVTGTLPKGPPTHPECLLYHSQCQMRNTQPWANLLTLSGDCCRTSYNSRQVRDAFHLGRSSVWVNSEGGFSGTLSPLTLAFLGSLSAGSFGALSPFSYLEAGMIAC